MQNEVVNPTFSAVRKKIKFFLNISPKNGVLNRNIHE
jgi:hypothetical protein